MLWIWCKERRYSALPLSSGLETRKFISYWFADRHEDELARLATVLARHERPTKQALMIALSRIIVSKEMMVSLARDTSHSRPHKVAEENDFNVYAGFRKSAQIVARRLQPERIHWHQQLAAGALNRGGNRHLAHSSQW